MIRAEAEPICKVLPIAPSTYRLHAARQRDPSLLPDRTRRDLVMMEEIKRVFETNYSVYGARKVWRQLRREGRDVARCTVERLMRDLGLAGAIRGKPVKTTVSDKAAPCPLDKVNRQFHAPAPNRLWVADFTYVATWARFVHAAFVIDAFARRIVGWRVSRTAHAGFVLDALEQALHARRPVHRGGLNPPRLILSRGWGGQDGPPLIIDPGPRWPEVSIVLDKPSVRRAQGLASPARAATLKNDKPGIAIEGPHGQLRAVRPSRTPGNGSRRA